MSVKSTFIDLREETVVIAGTLFNKAVNHCAKLVKNNFSVRKPIVIDGKRITTVKGSTISNHIKVTTSETDKEMIGIVYVDPSDPQVLLDARRFENYPQNAGVGPFSGAALEFNNKEKLQKVLKGSSGKRGINDTFPDLEVH